MLVCHCEVVSDRAIRAAISDGASNVDAVGHACGAGQNCGGCIPGIEELLDDAATAVNAPAVLAKRQAARRARPAAPIPAVA